LVFSELGSWQLAVDVIAVIGGGITGLAAAHELTRRQVSFVLLEASPRLGGLIRTDSVDGFTIEAGPDSVLAQKPPALDLFAELGLTPHVISTRPPRTAFVMKRGRLYPLPSPSALGIPTTLGGVARYRLLPASARARVALEPLVPARRAGDESVAGFFRRRFGGATVGLVAEPLLGVIHAGDVEALSMHSLFPRFVEAEVSHGSVLHAFRGASGSPAGDGLFRALSGGMSMLVAAIERRLSPERVRLGAPALAITRAPGDERTWCVTTADQQILASAVIVAAPASAAATLLAGVDPHVSALCREVPYASTASIALAWRRGEIDHPLSGSGFVVARRHNSARITACTWVSSKWEGRAPEGMSLLRVFVGGVHDPQAIDLSDGELTEIAVRDMAPVLGIRTPPHLSRVSRWRAAGAQHNVGQLARMADIDTRLARNAGLFVAGSGFRSVGIPDCIADGRAAADAASTYVTIRGSGSQGAWGQGYGIE
jgi:oxygen-dependent protoporphyrinogen oxidase